MIKSLGITQIFFFSFYFSPARIPWDTLFLYGRLPPTINRINGKTVTSEAKNLMEANKFYEE